MNMSSPQRSRLSLFRICQWILAVVLILVLSIPAPALLMRPQPVQAQTETSLPLWSATSNDTTTSVAWGDVDNDGDLDLATSSWSGTSTLYTNTNGKLTSRPTWSAVREDILSDYGASVAWGDVDNDGDLDLAVGNEGQSNRLYRNDNGTLTTTSIWHSEENDTTFSIAWGDMDGDGDLDLAVGNSGPAGQDGGVNRIYRNDNGTLTSRAVWSSDEADATSSIAWGDMDGDGDLDLAVANGAAGVYSGSQPNRVYLNTGTLLETTASWVSAEAESSSCIAWGDMDSDGDLELAVANGFNPLRIYTNTNGTLSTSSAWQLDTNQDVSSVAWGDMDGDSDLDLVVGISHNRSVMYTNHSGTVTTTGTFVTAFEGDSTSSIALGDIDNDGDLDIAVGNSGQPDRLYRNNHTALQTSPNWSSTERVSDTSAAWGDVDGDGDLDLAVGSGRPEFSMLTTDSPNRLYRNTNGVLEPTAIWTSTETDNTYSIAWGDVDSDGDLDLAVGNMGQPNRLYRNDNGTLTRTAVWSSVESEETTSIAWGDVDGDGDLDLAVGNGLKNEQPNRLYRNDNGTLTTGGTWAPNETDHTTSIAWGDMDGDGDLDLLVGNKYEPVRMYRNDRGFLITSAVWSSQETDYTSSLALGDSDGDGDLDLAVGNLYEPNRIYRNDGGVLTDEGIWRSFEAETTRSMTWGDVDGDGDLDLAVGNDFPYNRIYRNDSGVLTAGAIWSSSIEREGTTSVVWGDVDGDGDLDMATTNEDQPVHVHTNIRDSRGSIAPVPVVHIEQPSPPASADLFASAHIWQDQTLAFRYTVSHPTSLPVRLVRGFYSLDGGDNWKYAIPTSDTQTTSLASSPTGTTHTYTWDVYASGVMGQSDNVIFRLVAIPAIQNSANTIAGPYMRGSYATSTYPFRIRGTQVRVLYKGEPVSQAFVYHLPANQTRNATPISTQSSIGKAGEPFRTDALGYLQGRGNLQVGDKLMALVPIESTHTYTLYHTSAKPNTTGVDFTVIEQPGVQTLTIDPDNPFVLFNLDISLEWDAHRDDAFLSRLRYDLARTSELLFDWTNGQAALGRLTVFQDHDYWDEAHVRVYATNRLRPNAEQGGVVEDEITDPDVSTTTYEPGQVRMGAIWNRFGESSGNLSEDWPRTLAHELGHYLFFLDDNYIGLNEDDVLIPIDTCPGAMSDPYRDDYSEFVAPSQWLPACQQSLSNQLTGRSDWQTIMAFYPMLRATPFNIGPHGLPLNVTDIDVVNPVTPTDVLDVPIFYLNKDGGRFQPGSSARALLFQQDADYAEEYPWVLDIGRPRLDQVEARGARPGDRLCVYDTDEHIVGCEDIVAGDDQMDVYPTDWLPDIVVSPVTSRTINLNVSNIPAGDTIYARLFPEQDPSQTITLTEQYNGVYSGTFTLENPAVQGYVEVWSASSTPTQPRQSITDYSMGGNPGRRKSRSGRRKSRSGRRKSRSGRRKSRSAPAVSSDGQVIIYGENLVFQEGEFYTLQASTRLQSVPPWMTVVGQAYWLSASENAPEMDDASISFGYLGTEAPAGEENWLRVYFWNASQQQWEKLPTSLDTYQNVASAPVQGPGLYALMSSIELPLTSAGWNLFAYPVQATRTVKEALQSIEGTYTAIYGYQADSKEPWRVCDPSRPEWVNTLTELSFGRGYWINVTRPVTVSIKGSAEENPVRLTSTLPNPPATYYGLLEANNTFQPAVGMRVTATISGTVCGESTVQQVDDGLGVVIHVEAEWPGGNTGCGVPGRPVSFTVGDYTLPETYVWDNTSLHNLNGYPLYLPLVVR